MNAIVNIFVDVPAMNGQEAYKTPILPAPLPFSRVELEMMVMALQKMKFMLPSASSAREAHSKVCSLLGAMAKWEREH